MKVEISSFLRNSCPVEWDLDALRTLITSHSQKEQACYCGYFFAMMNECNKSHVLEAAIIINDGCSDDAFSDFRAWLIAVSGDQILGILDDLDPFLASFSHGELQEAVTNGQDYLFLINDIAVDSELGLQNVTLPKTRSANATILNQQGELDRRICKNRFPLLTERLWAT
jgi:hypothetical protein